jgi:hypothetical protein
VPNPEHPVQQAGAELFQVAGTSPGNVWAFGNRDDGSVGVILRYEFLLHWTGSAWRQYVAPAGLPTSDGLATDGSGGLWAAGEVSRTPASKIWDSLIARHG